MNSEFTLTFNSVKKFGKLNFGELNLSLAKIKCIFSRLVRPIRYFHNYVIKLRESATRSLGILDNVLPSKGQDEKSSPRLSLKCIRELSNICRHFIIFSILNAND